MAANTDLADINEIQMGYFLSNKWSKFVDSSDAQKQLKEKKKKVSAAEFLAQTEKAESMAKEVIGWAKSNGYEGSVYKVWWTARPGVLARAVGQDVDSRKNPTDILVQFTDKQFLGLSAKSTKTNSDIGFKNPGVGTVEDKLKIKLSKYNDAGVKKLLEAYPKLSVSASARKSEIRHSRRIADAAEDLGKHVLGTIRNKTLEALGKMSQRELRQYILSGWLDAKDNVYPRYIKVTGMKSGAKIEDPLANSKLSYVMTKKISVIKVGTDSIGILAGDNRIMKIRAKYESQKLASTVKFSGDPW